jgi:plasmid maintenance system antidote protein VapI
MTMNYTTMELRDFIKSRELIDIRKLAEASGVPEPQLKNFLDNSQDLTENQVSDLENLLSDYGYRSETVID